MEATLRQRRPPVSHPLSMPPDPHASDVSRRGRRARIAYLLVILVVTLPPPILDLTAEGIMERLRGALDLSFTGRDVVDAARNLLLFAGWGAVWVVTTARDHASRGVRPVLVATLLGALISLSVETLQLFSPYRISSLWDLLSNTAGSFLGAVVLLAMIRAVEAHRGARSHAGLPAFVFAGAYGVAVLLEATFPLFETGMIPGSGGGPLDRLARAWEAFEWSSLRELPLHHLVLFPPAGALAVAALVEAGRDHATAARWVALSVLPLFLAVEVVGGVAGHPMMAGAVLLHAGAVAAGGWVAARYLPAFTRRFRGRSRPALLLAVYALLLALWSWRPLTFVTSLAALREGVTVLQFVPLLAHSMRFDLFSVADIARQFALLVPVGGLLAVWPLSPSGSGGRLPRTLLKGPFPGVWLAFSLEGGQILVEGRMFDITDALVGVAAVLIGWTVVRRAGMTPWGALLAAPGERAPARTRGSVRGDAHGGSP